MSGQKTRAEAQAEDGHCAAGRQADGHCAAGHYADGLVDDVMVVGVGGQGVIVAAAIIADTALLHGGLEVKLSETRGMSQRGGSVCSHIRIGEKVVAPSISPGEVDYLLAFEAAEGLRFAVSIHPGGVAIVNTQQIVPPLASQGTFTYPFDAIERLDDGSRRVIAVDGNAVAGDVGDVKVAGMVLVGALSLYLPFAAETWERAIERNVSARWFEMNLAAFAAGRRVGAAAEVAGNAGGGERA
jgi:indolepyruvate ferredoxin oxidoreductase beta subunit